MNYDKRPNPNEMFEANSRSPSPDKDIFSLSTTLVPERENKQATTTKITFDGLLTQPLILHEDLQEGCGGQLWPAGMVLAKYLLQHHKTSFKDKQIIEIGAGGGLVGLAVALGCETNRRILITDQEPMLALMETNIELNGLAYKVSPWVYDWGTKWHPLFNTVTGHPDVVLAADCVYFEPAFPLLLQTLQDLIGPSTICFFCFKKRRKADMRFIRDMCKMFDCELAEYGEREKDRRESIFLYKVTRNGTRA